jgi:hypothetical protein
MDVNANHATITGHKSPVKMMTGSKITVNAMDANVSSVNHANLASHATMVISAEMGKTVGMGKIVETTKTATMVIAAITKTAITNRASKTVLKRCANLHIALIRR